MSTMESFKEDLSMKLFGRSSILALAGNQCVECGKPATHFRDDISKREWTISGFCQRCQDEVFCNYE